MSKRLSVILAAFTCVALLSVPTTASAAAFTFNFNCVITAGTPDTCGAPAGSYGALTISDSLVDPLRVNIDLTITPPTTDGQLLERFYLNFDSSFFVAGYKFSLVAQDAPPGTNLTTLGVVSNSNNFSTFGDFRFDLIPNPTSTSQTLHAALGYFNDNTNPDTAVNIDASMFVLPSTWTGTPNLFAAYRTQNGTCPAQPTVNCGEFWAGATLTPTPDTQLHSAPEPASLLLMGTGVAGVVAIRRRAARK